MNLLIIGAPGTGKGTMSSLIINDYDVVHVSTGDMLREAINDATEVGLLAKSYMEKGQLVPDETIHNVIYEYFKKNSLTKGFLFDGYPRTVAQAQDFDKLLASLNMKLDRVLYLSMDDEALKDRITGRRVCPNCNAIYHITNKPSKVEGVCDECGNKLVQRSDDTVEALNKRLDAFYKQTKPVVDYYDKVGLVSYINSDQSTEDVYKDIKKALEDVK